MRVLLLDPATGQVLGTLNGALKTESVPLAERFSQVGGVTYHGRAVPGSSTADAVWQIRKLTYDANGNLTAIDWAGTGEFDKVWSAHLTYF